MSDSENDLIRLKDEYKNRQIRLAHSDVYSSLNLAYLFVIQQRQRAIINLLHKVGVHSLSHKRILEVGCGQGDVLQEMMFHRMEVRNLNGVELLPDRLNNAIRRFPGVNFVCADGQKLPYQQGQFDLVLQFTMFSSILNTSVKMNIAKEMLRVLARPNGLILWYDFWLNPTNPQTKGIRKAEIKHLFPNCAYTFRRVTLAPPLSRKLVTHSWGLGIILEKLGFLNTHFLVAIQPKSG